jgi:hypothetical protein
LGFGAHKTHKSNQKMGFWDSFEHLKVVILQKKNLSKLRQVLYDKSSLRFMGPIKVGIWAHKDHKSTHNYGFEAHKTPNNGVLK